MHAESIQLAGTHVWYVPVPAEGRHLGQVHTGLGARAVEETELHALGNLGKH
jgi:hypothetical protein